MNEYLSELYDWISSQDNTFQGRRSIEDFISKMQDDSEYNQQMYSWISSVDDTFKDRYTTDAFQSKTGLKKKEELQPTSQEVATESITKEEEPTTLLESSEKTTEFEEVLDYSEEKALPYFRKELESKGFSIEDTGIGNALLVTDNITGEQTEIDLKPIEFFGASKEEQIQKIKKLQSVNPDPKRRLLSVNKFDIYKESVNNNDIENDPFVSQLKNTYSNFDFNLDYDPVRNGKVLTVSKGDVSTTFELQNFNEPLEKKFASINKFIYDNINDDEAIKTLSDYDVKILEEKNRLIKEEEEKTIDISDNAVNSDLYNEEYFSRLFNYLESNDISIPQEAKNQLKPGGRIQQYYVGSASGPRLVSKSVPYTKEEILSLKEQYFGNNPDVLNAISYFDKFERLNIIKNRVDRSKKLAKERVLENSTDRESFAEIVDQKYEGLSGRKKEIAVNLEIAAKDYKLFKDEVVKKRLEEIASENPEVKIQLFEDEKTGRITGLNSSEPLDELKTLKQDIIFQNKSLIDLAQKSDSELAKIDSSLENVNEWREATKKNYSIVDNALMDLKSASADLGGNILIVKTLAQEGFQDLTGIQTTYLMPPQVERDAIRGEMAEIRKEKDDYFESMRNYQEAIKEGSFGTFFARQLATQTPNITLAIGTGAVGNAIGLSGGTISTLVSTGFGVSAAGGKYDEITTRQEFAEKAQKALNDLENVRDFLSEEDYFNQKYELERASKDLDITSTDKTLSVVGAGLTEFGVSRFIGTVPNSLKVLKDLRKSGQFIDDLYRSNFKAVKDSGLELLKRTGGEIIEETSIETINKLNNYITLGDKIDFSDLDDVAVTSIITSGSMNTPGLAYSTLLSQSNINKYKSRVNGIVSNIINLKESLKDPEMNDGVRDIIHRDISDNIKQLSNVTTELEGDALLLGAKNLKDLLMLSGMEKSLLEKAGVEVDDNYDQANAKVKAYIDTLDKDEANKYTDKLNFIDQKRKDIVSSVDYTNAIEEVFGEKGTEIAKDLDPTLTPQQKYVEVYKRLRDEINDNAKKEFDSQITEEYINEYNEAVRRGDVDESFISEIEQEEIQRYYDDIRDEEDKSRLENEDKYDFIHSNLGRIRPDDYNSFGDKNKRDKGFAIKYFSKSAIPLDDKAMELSEIFGEEITPQDIIDYIDDRELNPDKYRGIKDKLKKLNSANKINITTPEVYDIYMNLTNDEKSFEYIDKLKGDVLSDEQVEIIKKHLNEKFKPTNKRTGTDLQQVNEPVKRSETETFEEIKSLDVKTNLQKIESFLDKIDNDLDKFGKETLGINIPVATARAIIKTIKALVKAGVTLEQAIKDASKKHNVKESDINDLLSGKATVEETDGVSKLRDMFGRKQVSGRPSIDEVRKYAKENGISNSDSNSYLKELGYTQDEIASFVEKDEEIYVKKGNKVVDWLRKTKRYLLSAKGFLPKNVFIAKEKKDQLISAEISIAERTAKRLNKLLKNQSEEVLNEVNNLMNGKVFKLPREIALVAKEMREHIDSLSIKLVESGAVKSSESIENIKNNLGSYLNRSYRVFDDENWASKVSEEVIQEAKQYLKNSWYSQESKLKMAEELSEKQGIPLDEWINQKVDQEVNDIVKQKEANSFIVAATEGSKNLKVLKQRKEIPAEIRALMGEYNDPAYNYVVSVAKIINIVENQKFLEKIKDIGDGVFLFKEGEIRRGDDTRYVKVAAESNESLAPLNGYYMPKEIVEELKNQDLITLKDAWFKKIYTGWLKSVAAVKKSKTIYSVGTHGKNVFGNARFMAQNGYLNPSDYNNAFKVLKNQFKGATDTELNELLDKYKKLGIINQSVNLNEIRSMFSGDDSFDIRIQKRMLDQTENKTYKNAKQKLKNIDKFLEDMYQAEDDLFKIVAYENEKRDYSDIIYDKKYEELTETEKQNVDDYVSNIVKNILPNYSRIGNLGKGLKFIPVTGTFISFQIEAYRTAYNTLGLAINEIKSDNAKMRTKGAKRLVALMAVEGLKQSLLYFLGASFLGDDDEEEKVSANDVRPFLPEWAKNSDIIVTSLGDGKFSYINVSASDPYGGIFQILNAVARGEYMSESIAGALKEFSDPVLSQDIFLSAIDDIVRNKTQYGGDLIEAGDDIFDKTGKWSERLWTAFEPGTLTSIRKIMKSKEGAAYETIGQFTGLKPHTVDVKKILSFKLKDLKEDISEIKKEEYRAEYKVIDTGELGDLFEAYKNVDKKLDPVFKDANNSVKKAMRLGVSIYDIDNILTQKRFSNDDASMILFYDNLK